MSKFNREKRALWRLKLHKRFLGIKLVGKELDVALRGGEGGHRHSGAQAMNKEDLLAIGIVLVGF